MKLSVKQKEVIKEMRDGHILHWMGGIEPRCFLSKNFTFKVSVPTCLKLGELGLITRKDIYSLNGEYQLTELGKTISID